MTLRFAESGGQYHQSNVTGPGIWATANQMSISSAATIGRNGSTWAYQGGGGGTLRTPQLSTPQGTVIAGVALLTPLWSVTVIQFLLAGALQCDVRVDANGHLFFTRNGTNIGSISSNVLTQNVWHY